MRAPLLPALLLASCFVSAQTPAAPEAEAHYHLLLENDQVRAFRLTLHRDESALVRLDHSFMTVALQDGEIIVWDDGKSPIQHFQVHKGEMSFHCWSSICQSPEQLAKGLSGGYRNDRPGAYRNITVEFQDPNIGWDMSEGGLLGMPGSMFLGGAVVAEVLLQPGDSFPAPDKPGPELIIPVSDVDLKLADGTVMRSTAGEVEWIPAARISALKNHGRNPASFVVVEFQPDNSSRPLAP